jgi:UPF0716 protein FxsA
VGRYVFAGIVAAVLLELASIIWVGGRLGVFPTLGLMILAGMAGVSVLKAGGAGLFASLRQPPRDLHFASREAASRFLMLVAGLLLLLPGFASDVVALLLLVPPVRGAMAARLASKVTVHTAQWQSRPAGDPLVIEGEAMEIDVGPRERQ